jgi:probable HAF family extracellular repeat protein
LFVLRRVALIVAFVALCAVASGWSARSSRAPGPAYIVTDLGALPGDAISAAYGVDASGRAVGYSQRGPGATRHAVVFGAGVVTDLGVLAPGGGSRGLAVGPGGEVYGYAGAAPYDQIEPVVFAGGGRAVLPLPAGDAEGAAFGVNSLGQAVGYTEAGNGTDRSNRPHGSHAVVFSGGTATPLGVLPGDSQSAAYAINDSGQAVGYSQGASHQHAALFSGGNVADLGTLPGDTDSAAFSVNAFGRAVGYSAGGGRFHPVMFADGAVIPLAELGGQRSEEALGVNDDGVAVGVSDSDGFHHHAVLYENGSAYALDAQLPSQSGWTLETATGINGAGQIVGQGVHNGQRHAYLLTPTGTPPSGGHTIPADATPSAPASLKASAPKITVRYDYMVLPGPDGHSDAPDPAAIQAVVDAFARHGIRLVIQPTHAAIPERDVVALDIPLSPGTTGPDAVTLADLKATYFPDADASVHYAVFGFYSDCDSDPHCNAVGAPSSPVFAQSGISELPGHNFVVSLGNYLLEKGNEPTLYTVGGTFMHELGHNLGLHHDGLQNDPLYAPNYLSVMSYQYEFVGIPYAAAPGSNAIAGFRLDYSAQALPTAGNTPGALDENANLNEPAGLGSGNADLFAFTDGQCGFQIAATTGPVDWNGDGDTTDTNATADVNANPLEGGNYCAYRTDVVKGFDDWSCIPANLKGHPNAFRLASPAFPREATPRVIATEQARFHSTARHRVPRVLPRAHGFK